MPDEELVEDNIILLRRRPRSIRLLGDEDIYVEPLEPEIELRRDESSLWVARVCNNIIRFHSH